MSQPGVGVLCQKAEASRHSGHINDALQNYQKAIYYNKILNTSSEDDVRLGVARIPVFVSPRIPQEILEVVWLTCLLRYSIIKFDENTTRESYKLSSSFRTCLRAEEINPGAVIHRTCTRDYSSAKARWRNHRRYRLVLQDCRGNLSTFKNVKELLSVMHDALIAHEDAYTKANVLYRNINVGNILITEDGKGLLVDWELSKPKSELAKAQQPERTGTWQFISAALLSNPDAHATRADCLESYFHVLGWIALQYTNHSTSPSRVAKHLTLVYDDYDEEEEGRIVGGFLKRIYMKIDALAEIGFTPGPLADLIEDLEETCASRYARDPDPEQVEITLEALANEDLSPRLRKAQESNIHYRVYERRKRLTSSKWFIDRFKEAIVSDKWSERSLERHKIRLPMKKHWP